MSDEIPNVLNYGGGTQTVAMCVLIANGILPRPDRIVMADTSREVQSTFDYLEAHTRPLMRSVGLEIEIAPHTLATVDLYSHKGTLLLPVFTDEAKFSSWCSGEWKTEVIHRHLRATGVAGECVNWVGYAFDEKRRWKGKNLIDGPWRLLLPLVDRMITTADCQRIIRHAGLPRPPKSRCFMCPNQPNAEWRELREGSPAEFEAACVIDEAVRDDDEFGTVYLHQSRVPLREADLDAPDRREPDRQCSLGLCFV